MTDEDKIDVIRGDCWDRALDAFGYNYIYAKRVGKISPLLNLIKVIGIVIPVLIGGIATSYSAEWELLTFVIIITTPLAVIQLCVSAYVSVVGTEEKVNSYVSKTIEYSYLNSEFESMARLPDPKIDDYQLKYSVLVERERNVGRDNLMISDKEKRMGMRSGLRNYRRSCAGCNETPTSMNPSQCDVCGKF